MKKQKDIENGGPGLVILALIVFLTFFAASAYLLHEPVKPAPARDEITTATAEYARKEIGVEEPPYPPIYPPGDYPLPKTTVHQTHGENPVVTVTRGNEEELFLQAICEVIVANSDAWDNWHPYYNHCAAILSFMEEKAKP
jgi:hypothetical protein